MIDSHCRNKTNAAPIYDRLSSNHQRFLQKILNEN